jgi:proteasome lid subunit RPN8/RPN11
LCHGEPGWIGEIFANGLSKRAGRSALGTQHDGFVGGFDSGNIMSAMSSSKDRVAVRDRVELNRSLPPVSISATVLNELCRHALDVIPEECCGLITGTDDEVFKSVSRITNVMTRMHVADEVSFPRDARTGYYMAETEYLRVQQAAEGRGERVTAVYHSHVNVDAYLSPEDRIYAESPLFPFPGAFQIVLSVVGDRVKDSAVFEMDPDVGAFTTERGRLLQATER